MRLVARALLVAVALTIVASAGVAGELGLNVFGVSVHTDRTYDYNEINPGLGLHYVFARPRPRWELFADGGTYYDSERYWAKYIAAGAHFRFAKPWMAGIAIAYGQSRSYNDGKPMFAPVPSLAYDFDRFALNAVVLPSENNDSKVAGIAFFVTVPLWHDE